MAQYVINTGIMKTHLLSAHNWDFHQMVMLLKYLHFFIPMLFTGAIAITGGQFSNATVSVVIGSVECVGNETSLLDCSHVTENHEVVTQCDPVEVAAVTCHGMLTICCW